MWEHDINNCDWPDIKPGFTVIKFTLIETQPVVGQPLRGPDPAAPPRGAVRGDEQPIWEHV